MQIKIIAIGRLRHGPEAELISDYTARFKRLSRQIGMGEIEILELEAAKSSPEREAELIVKALPPGYRVIGLDERGRMMPSERFAETLSELRAEGLPGVAFLIGGASGFAPEIRARCDALLSFGAMVWPHALVRAMLCEQLYRAGAILTGSPYHKA